MTVTDIFINPMLWFIASAILYVAVIYCCYRSIKNWEGIIKLEKRVVKIEERDRDKKSKEWW